MCGDGFVDVGEECDEGQLANSDHAYCTEACKLNYCGDGLLFLGWELCDEGDANSDAYGATCTTTCQPGARCGDNLVQEGEEECDQGPMNGTGATDGDGISCDALCNKNARRAFVTSAVFTGALGGLAGADQACRDAAEDAGLPDFGRFMAFLSDADTSIQSRYGDELEQDLPLIFVTGKKLADSFAALITSGPADDGFVVAEDGSSLTEVDVATNIGAAGTTYSSETECAGWSSASGDDYMRVGLSSWPKGQPGFDAWKSQGWTSYKSRGCFTEVHLYCLEL